MYNNSRSCVRLNNGLTKPLKSGVGVRQGDVPNPNLFKIFINDLPDYFLSCPDPVKLQNKYLHCFVCRRCSYLIGISCRFFEAACSLGIHWIDYVIV